MGKGSSRGSRAIANRFVRAVSLVALFGSIAPAVTAQPLFGDPLASPAAYRSERGKADDASYRLRFSVRAKRGEEEPVTNEVVMDLATDWALVDDGKRRVLHDFRLNRTFTFTPTGFATVNGLADLVFRVMERQNRKMLHGALAQAGATIGSAGGGSAGLDDCGADANLGLRLPSDRAKGEGDASDEAKLRQRGSKTILDCGERELGRFEPSEVAEPPASFWPTMFIEMTMHPVLRERIRATGRPPAMLESVDLGSAATTRRRWRLVGVEERRTIYPLGEDLKNETRARLDALLAPGAGRLAVNAIAGRAEGGPPTLSSWTERLERLEREERSSSAAMLILPTLGMFPQLEAACARGGDHPICRVARDLRQIAKDDPAPLAVIEIATSEQGKDPQAAIAAMKRARISPNRDHPALAAAFALALLRLDRDALARVRDAELPTDVAALQMRALAGLPYNPGYWADVGDRFALAYEWFDAFLFYDVAFSLPMPDAIATNRALAAKRDLIERIRRDFPEASLPR